MCIALYLASMGSVRTRILRIRQLSVARTAVANAWIPRPWPAGRVELFLHSFHTPVNFGSVFFRNIFFLSISTTAVKKKQNTSQSSLVALRRVRNPSLNHMLRLELPDERWIPARELCSPLCRTKAHQRLSAIPRSLQHRIRAFDLAASCALAMPVWSKYSDSPRATATRLASVHQTVRCQGECATYRPRHTKPHSRVTCRSVICDPPRGASPQPPGPNA